MKGGLLLWPCFGNNRSSDADVDVDLDPVVLVSGIGGSILNSKSKKFGIQVETRVWVRILLADLEFRKKALSVYNPKTGYTEGLEKDAEIVVPDDDYGLYAIDILDPSSVVKCLHVTEVYHFHDMIDMLVNCGYKKGTTLFGYGYDFRQSVRIGKLMEGLREKLESAYKASGGRKVNIITHSMGGLLVQSFLSLHSDVFAKYVKKWIAIACPFQGAPGCVNDSLLTGLQFVEGFESFFFVSRWSMHQLLIECPSMYEMLANPEFNWKKPPQIQVWQKQSKDGSTSVELETYVNTECITLFEEALKNNELEYDGKTIGLPFNFAILKWASETRKVLNNAKLPDGVSFYNIYGTSFDTPYDVWYVNKQLYKIQNANKPLVIRSKFESCSYQYRRYGSETSPIENLSEICHSTPQYLYVDGDGTVPTESAMADGFEAVERVAIAGTHRQLLQDNSVFKFIQKWLGVEQKEGKHPKTSRVTDIPSSSMHVDV